LKASKRDGITPEPYKSGTRSKSIWMASWFVSAPERAKSPAKSTRDLYSGRTKERATKNAAKAFVIKLLLIFKTDPLFKSQIIQKRYHYATILLKRYE
jgi:hypothetical protein